MFILSRSCQNTCFSCVCYQNEYGNEFGYPDKDKSKKSWKKTSVKSIDEFCKICNCSLKTRKSFLGSFVNLFKPCSREGFEIYSSSLQPALCCQYHSTQAPKFPNSSVDTDSLPVMVTSDEELASDCERLDTALKLPVRANELPIRANEPPTTVSEPQSEANKPPDEAVKRPNAPTLSANAADLYDPDSQHPSWQRQADLTAFLEKQFRRKLSYDQVSDILDSYSIPSVDCLFSPTLDNSVLNQISPLKSRKYTQERDKELASVQRSMLNITGPLCCLHDTLCSD